MGPQPVDWNRHARLLKLLRYRLDDAQDHLIWLPDCLPTLQHDLRDIAPQSMYGQDLEGVCRNVSVKNHVRGGSCDGAGSLFDRAPFW